MACDAFFLPMAQGQRLCLLHGAAGAGRARGAVVFAHAFGEEMNKSRRMAALQARALAGAGYAVMQIDLAGCGDSSGDFGDATWEAWIADLHTAATWLRGRVDAPLWFWGHRVGCLLAAAAARRLDEPAHFLFWQPVVSGRQFLQQLFRLKLAGEMMDGNAKGMADRLRGQLADGMAVEIAGYAISPALAAGLDGAALEPAVRPARLEWLEMSARPEAELTPVAEKHIAAWRAAGHRVGGRAVAGPQFWQTTEIEECPALLEATVAAMDADG